jgi:NADH:ubiquinone oxidoreductase subunit 2 (subunit N)
MMPLAITLAIASAISVYYYLGIALAAFVAEPSEEAGAVRMNPGTISATALCAAGVFLVAIFFAPITQALVGDTAGTAGEPISVQTMPAPIAMEAR